VFANGTISNVVASHRQAWNVSENDPAGRPKVGTYDLQVTAVASAPANVKVAAGTAKQWNIEGTLDATYTGDASTGAAGDITVHVQFHDKSMF